jgi:multiple sugar transport system permease protein
MRQREGRAGLALLSPTLVIVLVVVVLPVLWTIMLAFQHIRLATLQHQSFLGPYTLSNFVTVLSSPEMWSSLGATLAYTIGGTVLTLVIGLIAALALRKPFRGRSFLRGAMLLPYVAPVVAATFV